MLFPLLFLAIFVQARSSFSTGTPPTYSCTEIDIHTPHGARTLSIQSNEKRNYTVHASSPFLLEDIPNLNICEVLVTLTHPGANDKVLIQVWLPLHDWNGRFVAAGGSGWSAGLGEVDIGPFVAKGYAASSTNAGLTGGPASPGEWALTSEGEVNLGLLTNFASRSIHDMAVIGKMITRNFYHTMPRYSYWSGCSTGGRQGLVAAQKYPKDFDGILAGAPAIYWDKYVVAEQWPQVVMKEEKNFPSMCEMNAISQLAIAACDGLDKVKDGVISNLPDCKFDPMSQVGSKIQCDGHEITISHSVASVVRQIWNGPSSGKQSLWYGLNIGAPLGSLAATKETNGTRIGDPFFVNAAWIRYFLKQDPDLNLSTIDYRQLSELFLESERKYANIIGSANTDLSELRKSGGKLLVWHGEADQLIFPQGTVRYRHEVEDIMGGTSKVDKFFRLFLAPGVDHCGSGSTPGAIPIDPLGALVSWVEDGRAPDILDAITHPSAAVQFTRKICRYPWVAKYRSGDVNQATSYTCYLVHRG